MEPSQERGEADVVFIAREADFVVQVWATGAGAEGFDLGWVELEGLDDVCADGGRGGCGEAYYGDGGEGLTEVGEVGVGFAEVVAPF